MGVVLFGSPADPQVLRVSAALTALSVAWRIIETSRFPEEEGLSLDSAGVIHQGERVTTPSAVYVRGLACHPLMPSLSEILIEHPRRVVSAMEEKRALLESILLCWQSQGALLVNGPSANAQHSRKPLQLSLLDRAGLRVPPWLATNDPATLHDWLRDHGPAVYKPLAGGATVRRVDAADLTDERLEQLAAAPVLFQQLVEGVSVRAYVVGDKVVAAAEIHSGELDYRRGEDAVIPTQLSAEESRMAIDAARLANMPFAGVDFIRGAEYTWLLESNPSPMFANFEEKTGLNVATPLAAFLARAAG
jgi:hypothetical protein